MYKDNPRGYPRDPRIHVEFPRERILNREKKRENRYDSGPSRFEIFFSIKAKVRYSRAGSANARAPDRF